MVSKGCAATVTFLVTASVGFWFGIVWAAVHFR